MAVRFVLTRPGHPIPFNRTFPFPRDGIFQAFEYVAGGEQLGKVYNVRYSLAESR